MQTYDEWYGWIPTNLGRIQFGFIDKDNISNFSKKFKFSKSNNVIHITDCDLSFVSDTSYFKKVLSFLSSKKEYYPKADIILNDNSTSIEGSINFIYYDNIHFDIDFILELNGKVKFILTDLDNKNYIEKDSISGEIKQVVYTILKLVIHGDSHHHYKIDNALEVTVGGFNTSKILDSMLLHLKFIERNIKSLKRKCSTRLKQNIILDEVNGYISYINTFVILFPGESSGKNKLQIALNIRDSLKAIINKREKKFGVIERFKASSLTFFALIITTIILTNSFYGKNYFQDNGIHVTYMPILSGSIIFWVVIYGWFNLCNFESWLFYKKYPIFRFVGVIYDYFYKIIAFILIAVGLFLSYIFFSNYLF